MFHSGSPRVSRLTKNVVLPRSIPLPVFIAAPVGLMLGFIGFKTLQSVLGWLGFAGSDLSLFQNVFIAVGGGLATLLVAAEPWRGEHVHRVAAVRAAAIATTKKLLCPGSALPTVYSDEAGTLICVECSRIFTNEHLLAPQHDWSRRVYLGMKPIPHPITGEVHFISGSVPTHHPESRFYQ